MNEAALPDSGWSHRPGFGLRDGDSSATLLEQKGLAWGVFPKVHLVGGQEWIGREGR